MKSKKLDDTIIQFRNILLQLNKGRNIVLGGTHAMLLHGLNVPREPNDLDIIVYEPTKAQLDLLESLKDLISTEGLPKIIYMQRSFKLEKSIYGVRYVLDILLEWDSLPEGLLIYENKEKEIYIKVQSIENIVRAKNWYGRIKDVTDFLQLKNLNFNL